MKCKQCGMEYDGPPEKFPESGLCPGCSQTDEERQAFKKWRADADQLQREQEEAYKQGHIDD